MTSLLGSVRQVVHDAASALIDRKVTTKFSDAVSALVASGFGVIEDALKVTRDLTTPPADSAAPSQPKQDARS